MFFSNKSLSFSSSRQAFTSNYSSSPSSSSKGSCSSSFLSLSLSFLKMSYSQVSYTYYIFSSSSPIFLLSMVIVIDVFTLSLESRAALSFSSLYSTTLPIEDLIVYTATLNSPDSSNKLLKYTDTLQYIIISSTKFILVRTLWIRFKASTKFAFV